MRVSERDCESTTPVYTKNRVRETHATPTKIQTLASWHIYLYICTYKDRYKPCFEPGYALDRHKDSTLSWRKLSLGGIRG